MADEPVAMLDMSVRALVLELMADLRRDLGLTYVLITHDLATARLLCDRVAVMYLGRVVEIGPATTVLTEPRHPYTKALLEAVPRVDPAGPLAGHGPSCRARSPTPPTSPEAAASIPAAPRRSAPAARRARTRLSIHRPTPARMTLSPSPAICAGRTSST